MTREEAWNMSGYMSIDIIDMIYDDIESRVCENCKYCKERSPYDEPIRWRYSCVNKNNMARFVDLDFGCNKFERKLESK